MAVYQTYVNAMNDKIKNQIAVSNPFVFKHISNLKVILLRPYAIQTYSQIFLGHRSL